MLSFCAICPHPPILLPTIGSIEDRKKVKKTISALEKLEKEFKETETESLIIISPHGIINPDHFSITSAKDLFGDLFQFGDFSSFFEFQNDLSLVEEISKKAGVPVGKIAYIGDDINDLEVLKEAGFSAVPANAEAPLLNTADYICINKIFYKFF